MNRSLAIITARGGSKRIPRKNIKDFLGFPIIKYSIVAALNAKCFDEVMVSTDDIEIANISRQFGAIVPFIRSETNSNDHAGTAEVIREVITEYERRGECFDQVCCIYPTAPFIKPEVLATAMSTLGSTGADCVLPVVAYSYPIQRSLKIGNGLVKMIWPENYSKRSQDLERVYHDCGQFYCLKTSSLKTQMKLFCDHTVPIILNESVVQDIDTEEDWKIAEMKYQISLTEK